MSNETKAMNRILRIMIFRTEISKLWLTLSSPNPRQIEQLNDLINNNDLPQPEKLRVNLNLNFKFVQLK
jgi:hypothetical protein